MEIAIAFLVVILLLFLICIRVLFAKCSDLRSELCDHWTDLKEVRGSIPGGIVINGYVVPLQSVVQALASNQPGLRAEYLHPQAGNFKITIKEL